MYSHILNDKNKLREMFLFGPPLNLIIVMGTLETNAVSLRYCPQILLFIPSFHVAQVIESLTLIQILTFIIKHADITN